MTADCEDSNARFLLVGVANPDMKEDCSGAAGSTPDVRAEDGWGWPKARERCVYGFHGAERNGAPASEPGAVEGHP